MNRKFIVAGAGLLVGGGLAMLALNYYWQRPPESPAVTAKELDEHAARLGIKLPPAAAPPVRAAPPIDPKKPVRLAIGWLGLPDEAQNGQVGDLVLADLSAAKNLQLVDRQSLDKVLHETQMGLSGLTRAADATRVGKLLRADWFMLGSAAVVNGSNYVVVRVVDARTGVMLNATVLAREGGAGRLAEELAAFARQSRETASHPGKPRVYLAIGGFKDVSVNDRQADFPAKLRAYLMAAYQGDRNVTLLEREFADVLLREMHLDLAGLTEEGAGAVQPMQSAFWLVDGYYQSFETTGFEVEVVLRVHRMFGISAQDTLRGPPEESFYRQIKSKIDLVLTQQADQLLVPTRRSEIQVQSELGRELSRSYVRSAGDAHLGYYWGSAEDGNRTRHNLEEAIRAYQTVLVLDPENHEAKMGLAACFQHPLIGKVNDARSLVREVAESSIEDRWRLRAMVALGEYYRYDDPGQAAEWFKRASEHAKLHPTPAGSMPTFPITRGSESAEYLGIADEIIAEIEAGKKAAMRQPNQDPESRLVDDTEKMRDYLKQNSKRGTGRSGFGIETFIKSYGNDRAGAVKRLNELLPGLLEKFPEIAPDLLAIALPYQTDTNSSVVTQFMQSFERCAEHPDGLVSKTDYFWRTGRQCYDWCMQNKSYSMALRIVEVKRRVEAKNGGTDMDFGAAANTFGNSDTLSLPNQVEYEDELRLVYAYMRLERWQDALDMLSGFPKQPFVAGAGGVIIPSELISQCREKLGLPVEKDPRLFELGEPYWRYHDPGIFLPDEDVMWAAICCKLWKISLDLKTRTQVDLPKDPNTCISTVCNDGSKLWIGTMGDGLIEYDKQSHKTRRFTDKDGLLMNYVSAICVQGEIIWIGFANFTGGNGGFGRLDLRTGRASSFSASLRPDAAAAEQPPQSAVSGILAVQPKQLLVWVSGYKLRWYHISENTWETPQWAADRIAADSQRVVLAQRSGLIAMLNPADGHLEKFGGIIGMPSSDLTAVALNGNDLWIGGEGYIGAVDIPTKTLRKMCFIRAQTVDFLRVAGDYLWTAMDRCLYAIPLSQTR